MDRLSADGCEARRRRLFQQLQDPPDWVLISDPHHQMYFANYWASPFVFRSVNSAAVLLLGREGESILIADSMVGVYARQAHVDEVVCPAWYNGVDTARIRSELLMDTALERLSQLPGNHFGLESGRTPAGLSEGLRNARVDSRFSYVDAAIHAMKRRKDADELALLRRCMQAGAAAHAAAWRNTRPGVTELEVFLLVQDAANRAAGEQVQVYGDFVSGPRCQEGGGPPTQRVIEGGDLVLLDFSVVIAGYRGDFANTFCCGAKANEQQTRWAQACLNALKAGESVGKSGIEARAIDQAVKASFESEGLLENFRSHTGHGLGLGHPDPPYLTSSSSDILEEGDIIAIEPSQIIPGQAGMRFERNYLVTAKGLESLTDHPLDINQP